MNKEEFVDNFSIDLTNSTVAERKNYAEKIFDIIDDLQQQAFNKTLEFEGIEKVLKAKKQECERLKSENLIDNYKQALDEIEEFCIVYSNNHDAYETVYKHILDIINKAKDGK